MDEQERQQRYRLTRAADEDPLTVAGLDGPENPELHLLVLPRLDPV